MDFATKFALKLKQYFDILPTNVWNDFERNLVPDRIWDEDSILRTSIIRDGIDNNISLLQKANNNPAYKIAVKACDYGGQGNETITGADLAVIFSLEINKVPVSRRLILVQLKRAFFDPQTKFTSLHHESGKSYYGKDFHQAKKMLFFSTTPVYWFATTSAITEDESSMKAYSLESNLLKSSTNILPTVADSSYNYTSNLFPTHPLQHVFSLNTLAKMSSTEIEKHLEELNNYQPFHRFFPYMRGVSAAEVIRYVKDANDNLPYQLWQLLKNRLHQISFDNHGLPQRIGLFVCNAEDIYTLFKSKSNGFTHLYPLSIPFSQFILQNILCREFGDSNPKLIDAVLNKELGYFKNRAQEIADRYNFEVLDNIEELVPVKRSIDIKLSVSVADSESE